MIATSTLPDSGRRVITPAEALDIAYNAHQMVAAHTRHTSRGPRIELLCKCGSTISKRTEDETFDAWHDHLGDVTDTFLAQLVDPAWLGTVMAALTPDDARLDRLTQELAAQASLGNVTPPADDERWVRSCGCPTRFDRHAMGCSHEVGNATPTADDSTAGWLDRTDPLDVDDADRRYPCGCLVEAVNMYGHRLGCFATVGGAR